MQQRDDRSQPPSGTHYTDGLNAGTSAALGLRMLAKAQEVSSAKTGWPTPLSSEPWRQSVLAFSSAAPTRILSSTSSQVTPALRNTREERARKRGDRVSALWHLRFPH